MRNTAVLYPSVDAAAGVKRQQTTGASLGQPQAPLPAFHALQRLGERVLCDRCRRRRAARTRGAVVADRLPALQLEAAYLALTGNVVTTAVQEASLRAQIGATREVVEAQQRHPGRGRKAVRARRSVARRRARAARAAGADARRAAAAGEGAGADAQRARRAHRPDSRRRRACPSPTSRSCSCRRNCRSACPRSLRASGPTSAPPRRCCTSASAEIGVAEAAKYPQLTLSAAYGSSATRKPRTCSAAAALRGTSAQALLQPIFHARRARSAAARRGRRLRSGATRNTARPCSRRFRTSPTCSRRSTSDAHTLKAQAEAEASARASLELAQRSSSSSARPAISCCSTPSARPQQAKIGLVQAQAARFADTAALYQALGGGWWQRKTNIEKGSVQQ